MIRSVILIDGMEIKIEARADKTTPQEVAIFIANLDLIKFKHIQLLDKMSQVKNE